MWPTRTDPATGSPRDRRGRRPRNDLRLALGSALGAWRDLVVEVQQGVDVGDQARCVACTDSQQQIATRDQQLVAKLEGLSDIVGRIRPHLGKIVGPATAQARSGGAIVI